MSHRSMHQSADRRLCPAGYQHFCYAVGAAVAVVILLGGCGNEDARDATSQAVPVFDESLAAQGESLFYDLGCNTCHSVDGGSRAGPTMLGIYQSDRELDDGQTMTADTAYLRQAILRPRETTAAGYPNTMPAHEGILDDDEVDAIIEYLKSLDADSGVEGV